MTIKYLKVIHKQITRLFRWSDCNIETYDQKNTQYYILHNQIYIRSIRFRNNYVPTILQNVLGCYNYLFFIVHQYSKQILY